MVLVKHYLNIIQENVYFDCVNGRVCEYVYYAIVYLQTSFSRYCIEKITKPQERVIPDSKSLHY